MYQFFVFLIISGAIHIFLFIYVFDINSIITPIDEIPISMAPRLVVEYNVISKSEMLNYRNKYGKTKELSTSNKNLIRDDKLLFKKSKNLNNSQLILDDSIILKKNSVDVINFPIFRKNPIYPKRAKLLNIEGKIIALYNINARGRIENIRILYSNPPKVFDDSVRLAMLCWVYESNNPKNDLKIIFQFNLYSDIKISRR